MSISYLSDTTQRYGKAAVVALAILSALATLFLVFRCYKARELSSDETDIPTHLSPNNKQSPVFKPSPVIPQPVDLDKRKEEDKVNKQSPSATTEEDDLEFAKKLQERLLQEGLEDNEISDEALAKQLQDTFNKETQKSSNPFKPFTPVVNPSPKDANLVIPSKPQTTTKKPQEVEAKVETPKEKPKSIASSPFTQIENICGEIAERAFTDPLFSAVTALKAVNKQQVLDLLDEIIAEFEKSYEVSKKIKYGQQVPAYFANVKEESDNDRKYLSLVGIRNLLLCGPSIIDDFRDNKFLGGKHHYAANSFNHGNYCPGKGLNAFEYYTGNTVDLDIEIDAKNDADAIKQAEKMIVDFGKVCGLKKASGVLTAADVEYAMPDRKLDLPKPYEAMHTSTNHLDRSNHGIWKHISPSLKVHYHVNVPDCNIILLATLRMPYLMAELAYRTKEHNKGKLPKEFFDEFFDKGLSDKCFNDKARTFLDFYHTWNAKLDEVPSPEEEARQKIEKGVFGEALKQKGPKVVLKEAYNRQTLITFLDNLKNVKFATNGRSFEEWLKDEENTIRENLKKQGLWEKVLYQNEAGKDYFLLNQSTLNVFLKDFYSYNMYM